MSTYTDNEWVLRQGDDPDHIYLLAKGSVSVVFHPEPSQKENRQQPAKAAHRLHAFGPGACFGDLAVIEGSKRSASVRADQATTCYTLSTDELSRLESEQPKLHTKIMRNILQINTDRLRRANLEMSALKV